MSTKSIFKPKLLALAIAGLMPGAVLNAAEFTVADLGTLGGRYSLGLGVNDSGDVTGLSQGTDHTFHHGFLGKADTLPQALTVLLGGNYSQGQDINNGGQITGFAYLPGDAGYHAFVWQAPQGARDLGTLGAGGGNSQGLGINDKSQVAGVSTVNGAALHATVWSQNAGHWSAEDLGTLHADGSGDSRANAINENSVAAGFSTVPGTTPGTRVQRAVVWNKVSGNWVGKNLGAFQGSSFSSAAAINNSGLVAGSAGTANDAQVHAFVADSTLATPVLTDLKTLGGSYSEARGINAAGEVVGYSTTQGDLRAAAFLWSKAAGLRNLNSLIDANSGWLLLEAHAISDSGHISGIGLFNGEKHAFLLTRTDTTPPVVVPQWTPAVPNGANGWYVTPPTLVWSVTDMESAITGRNGCVNITAPFADTAAQTSTCSATSAGGTSALASTTVKLDSTAPVVITAAATAAELNGATSTPISFAAPGASDALSGVVAASLGCTPASGSPFARGVTPVTCSATDQAGNRGTASFAVTVTDPSPPFITPVVTGTAGSNGWYRGPVSLSWSVREAESPETLIKSGCTGLTQNTESVGVSDRCAASSAGGNTPEVLQILKVDATPPTLTLPAAIVAEATGPGGAAVTWTDPAASDALSGLSANGVVCTPASGSTFVLGAGSVSCSAADQAGNTATASFGVTVSDTTRPTLSLPANIFASTTNSGGTAVPFAVAATDLVSGGLPVSCTPASGSLFPIATTTVNCSASDAAGNTASGSFTITVEQTQTDSVPPQLSLPGNLAVTASAADGAMVSWNATAVDAVSGPRPVNCSPASGSLFPIAATTVTCSASDAAGNTASGSFTVTVSPLPDTTPPVLNLPADMVVPAADAGGAIVSYAATATDAVSGSRPVNCAPASGALFAVGTTVVNCSASDTAGNTASGSFRVTVSAPSAVADPAITGTVSNSSPRKGDTVSYSFVVRNLGAASAAGVTFTNTLPRSLRFQTLTTAPALSCIRPNNSGGGTVSCTLGTMAAGASATLTVAAKVDATGAIANPASVTSSSVDANVGNNGASVSLTAR